MQVFLLRHGTRNHTMGDVPLNSQGLLEAKRLASELRWQRLDAILSSPKKRAMMTVQPLAEKLNLPLLTFKDLDQMHAGEGEGQFIARVRHFLDRVQNQEFGQNILICSHSDWLSLAISQIPTDAFELTHHLFHCGEVIGFSIEDGVWKHLHHW
jgi:broad specificity phosphatase PhoE